MSRRNVALLLVLSGIWGSSFLFIKLGVDELEPSVVALGRLVVGAAILLPIAARRGGLGLLRPYLAVVATLGLLNNALPFWLFGFAETRISSGLAAVIQAAAPIFTVLLAIRLEPTQRSRARASSASGSGSSASRCSSGCRPAVRSSARSPCSRRRSATRPPRSSSGSAPAGSHRSTSPRGSSR